MSSKDLLEKLFDVEHEAETIVSQAREEAGRRLDAARTRAQASYGRAYDAALAVAKAARESSEKAALRDYEDALAAYKKKLETSRLDIEAFEAECTAILGKTRGEGR